MMSTSIRYNWNPTVIINFSRQKYVKGTPKASERHIEGFKRLYYIIKLIPPLILEAIQSYWRAHIMCSCNKSTCTGTAFKKELTGLLDLLGHHNRGSTDGIVLIPHSASEPAYMSMFVHHAIFMHLDPVDLLNRWPSMWSISVQSIFLQYKAESRADAPLSRSCLSPQRVTPVRPLSIATPGGWVT